jgi:hypothetical protein
MPQPGEAGMIRGLFEQGLQRRSEPCGLSGDPVGVDLKPGQQEVDLRSRRQRMV